MHNDLVLAAAEHHEHHHQDTDSTDVFGFWLYIMTDCMLFATLFATFLVLNHPMGGMGLQGPQFKNYLNLNVVLAETFLLLGSNLTFFFAVLKLYQDELFKVQLWLALTFLLGGGFIALEVNEFVHMANEGFRWDISGNISAFFTLVGTHGLHVTCGLLWILLMIFQLPLTKARHVRIKRMTYLGLFWNFLDIVWIFVFTIVYLMRAV